MVQRVAMLRYRRYNTYVPAMGYSHEVLMNNGYETDFGMPVAATGVEILNGQSIATAGTTTTFLSDTIGVTGPATSFGRNLSVVASGAATSTVTVKGKDYLGQGMSETFTLNGATAVQGVKAFRWIDSITYAATAGVTINVGYGPRLGLPFRMASVDQEIVNGSQVAVGTLTAGSLTDPATATTPDPRGLYTPTGALNGTNRILVIFAPYNVINSNGNGGLYGIPHFAG